MGGEPDFRAGRGESGGDVDGLGEAAPFGKVVADLPVGVAVVDDEQVAARLPLVVADTDSWEQKMAEAIEDMDETIRYVKNHNLGFTIPYTLNGEEHQYHPDFVIHVEDGHGSDHPFNLIVEVTGEKKKDKAAKVSTARNLWVPAINNHGGYGRWAFLEIADPWDAKNSIRSSLAGRISQ